MAELRLRPRFALPVASDVETLVEALRRQVGESEPAVEARLDPTHCVLRIPEPRRSFWSPELDLLFEPLEEGEMESEGGPASGIRVRCLFAPRPSVWTGFAFVYAVLSTAGLAGGLYGVAELTLGRTPWALAAVPASLLLLGSIYAVSYIGQGLAAGQMYELRRVLDAGVEDAEARARREVSAGSYQI